jgi:hypothetical protein
MVEFASMVIVPSVGLARHRTDLNVAQLKDEILKKKKGLIRIGHLPLV